MKHSDIAVDYKVMEISSRVFKDGERIPFKYTYDGENCNPPLDIKRIPPGTRCLAIIMEDVDTQLATRAHWIVWNIPSTHYINENNVHGNVGVNDYLQQNYVGPCLLAGKHRYHFKIYALDQLLDLTSRSGKMALEKVMSEHIIGFGELVGYYENNNNG